MIQRLGITSFLLIYKHSDFNKDGKYSFQNMFKKSLISKVKLFFLKVNFI